MAAEFNEALYQRLNDELIYEEKTARELYRCYVEVYVGLVVAYGKMYSKSYQEAMLRTGMTQQICRSDLPAEHIFRIVEKGKKSGEFRPDADKDIFWEQVTVTELGVNYAWSIHEEITDEAQRERACRLLQNLELLLLNP